MTRLRRDEVFLARPGRIRDLRALAFAVVVFAGAWLAIGCSHKDNLLRPNLAPETSVFVTGPIDTVNHRIRIHWFGTDPDGDVVGYRMRFVYPPPANQNPPWETVHCTVGRSCTDSLFTMFTGDSATVSPRFEVAAIDDDGAIDPTPAVQTFLLSNIAPTVQVTTAIGPNDTTYAALTLSWNVTDPDGGGPGLRYRIWLDGNEAGYDSTSELSFSVPSHRFLENGTYESGHRTLFIQAVDDGGRAGPPATVTWYVRAPAAVLDAENRGRVLVIDDVPSSGEDGTANATYDAFYQGGLSQLPAGSWSVLRPQFNRNIFRSQRDFAQTLRLFRSVIWYRGQQRNVSTLLRTFQDSLLAYVQAGGRVYLDGTYLIEGPRVPGALRSSVLPSLGATGFYLNFNGTVQDSAAGWSNSSASIFRTSAYGDTVLRTVAGEMPVISGQPPGIRAFVVPDTNDVVLWARENQLLPPNVGFQAPVGLVHDLGAGRIFLISLPLRAGAPQSANKIYNRILYGPARSLLGP